MEPSPMRTVAIAATATCAVVAAAYYVRERQKGTEKPSQPASTTTIMSAPSSPAAAAKSDKSAISLTPLTEGGASRAGRRQAVEDEDSAEPRGALLAARRVNQANKEFVRAWEAKEWEKARQRSKEMQARIAAREAAGIPDPVREESQRLLAAARAAAAAAGHAASDGDAKTAGEEPAAGGTAAAAALPGATAASLAAELKRWPSPPVGAAGCERALRDHVWPLYYDHYDWLDEVAARYSFADAGEALRHLIFVANGESAQVKKLIFKVIRCLHCHSGTRAGYIPKREKPLAVFDFQMVWLANVQAHAAHPSLEKTVRVLLDYYRKMTSDKPGAEAELFWRHRTDVTTRRGGASAAPSEFGAYVAGVPGNFFRPAKKGA